MSLIDDQDSREGEMDMRNALITIGIVFLVVLLLGLGFWIAGKWSPVEVYKTIRSGVAPALTSVQGTPVDMDKRILRAILPMNLTLEEKGDIDTHMDANGIAIQGEFFEVKDAFVVPSGTRAPPTGMTFQQALSTVLGQQLSANLKVRFFAGYFPASDFSRFRSLLSTGTIRLRADGISVYRDDGPNNWVVWIHQPDGLYASFISDDNLTPDSATVGALKTAVTQNAGQAGTNGLKTFTKALSGQGATLQGNVVVVK